MYIYMYMYIQVFNNKLYQCMYVRIYMHMQKSFNCSTLN